MSGLDLVVGGAGFIGSHLAATLLEAGRRVRVLDDLSTGKARNLPDGVDFVEGDAGDPAVAARACLGVERVFHLAARPSVPFSIEQPVAARHANLGTTEALLDAAGATGVRALVFSSSSAVYGDLPGLPKREDSPTAPQSPYAAHKLESERLLRAAVASGGPHAAALRYFNVYGPRQDPHSPYSGVISIFAELALRAAPPTVYGDGEQTRDFVHVSDVVAANLVAADALAGPPAVDDPLLVANVASGVTTSVNALWHAVWHAAGQPSPAPQPAHAPPRQGDIVHSAADLHHLRALGWRARTPLGDGLADTLAWMRRSGGR